MATRQTSGSATGATRATGPASTANGGGDTVTAVLRTADVLSLFARSTRPTLGVTEIAAELDLSKAVVSRILSSLRVRGFVELDEDTHRYALGPQGLMLGLAALGRIDTRQLAREKMAELSAATEETATLSVRTGWERVYVDQITPNRDIKMVVPIGRPQPLHAGASSKAFLAFMPPAEQDRFFAEADGLPALTPLTPTDPAALREELAGIRARGYAVSRGERQHGAGSVAAPVFGPDGQPRAVISVCGPVERFTPHMERAATLLCEATRRLSQQLGHWT